MCMSCKSRWLLRAACVYVVVAFLKQIRLQGAVAPGSVLQDGGGAPG